MYLQNCRNKMVVNICRTCAVNIFISLALLMVSGQVAHAQKRPSKGRKVIRLTGTTIEGRIQKPQAFYILQRSNLNFEGLALKKSFVPEIIKSVDKASF